jgi:hypothetical protein
MVLKLSYAIVSMGVVRVTATTASAARLHLQREKLRVLSSFIAAVLVLRRGGHMLRSFVNRHYAAKCNMTWSEGLSVLLPIEFCQALALWILWGCNAALCAHHNVMERQTRMRRRYHSD